MDIRQANELDEAIKIDEMNIGKPLFIVFKASLYLTISDHFDAEFWKSLPEGEKKALLDRLKESLKRYIIKLVCHEIANKGETWIEIKGEPFKYIYIDEDKFLALLNEEQMWYLKKRYDPVMRDIR